MADPDIQTLFPPVSKAQWTQQIVADLKGKPLDSLKRLTPDGFETEPFYTADDLESIELAQNQQAQNRSLGWQNVPHLPFRSESLTNKTLRDILTKGADGIRLDLAGFNATELDWKHLLNGVKLSDTPVWFQTDGQSDALMALLTARLPYQLKGGLMDEPIARYLQSGTNPDEELVQLAEATRLTQESPQFRTLTIGSSVFHRAGATPTQELAFTLNTLVDVYDSLTSNGLTTEQLIPKTAFSVSVGTSYFTEIAKLRALRILWQKAIRFYPAARSVQTSLFVYAETSTFYDATVSPYTNLIRATTEAMAAVLGGCNALTVHPYDAVFRESDAFADRIARNVSLLLQEEAHLDKTLDPAAGSYYLETRTAQLVETAWTLFLDVENRGGLRKAFEQGFIQDEIEKSYRTKVEAVKTGRTLVGVTKFRSDDDSVTKPVMKPARSLETLPVLPIRRLAQEFE